MLALRIEPLHNETLSQFIGRLAAKNCLPTADLLALVTLRSDRGRPPYVSFDKLAHLSGVDEVTLKALDRRKGR